MTKVIFKLVLMATVLVALSACTPVSSDPCHDCDDKNTPKYDSD